VVAPKATASIQAAAKAGKIRWNKRRYSRDDLAGVFLVIAATSSQALHEDIYRQARQAGILCNSVDEPERCDFFYPAVVRRGPLQIAVSTSGRAPALAQRLRRDLERRFGSDYGAWTEQIGRIRSTLLKSVPSPVKRKRLLRSMTSGEAFEAFRRKAGGRGSRGGIKQ
jgi:precorrin-2 dehydrogenase/sirohydrochlorin ferrochelatase